MSKTSKVGEALEALGADPTAFETADLVRLWQKGYRNVRVLQSAKWEDLTAIGLPSGLVSHIVQVNDEGRVGAGRRVEATTGSDTVISVLKKIEQDQVAMAKKMEEMEKAFQEALKEIKDLIMGSGRVISSSGDEGANGGIKDGAVGLGVGGAGPSGLKRRRAGGSRQRPLLDEELRRANAAAVAAEDEC